MPTNAEKIEIFHRKFDPTPLPLPELLKQREAFMAEEMREVSQAISDLLETTPENRTERTADLIKELCDLLVVTYGTLRQLGVDADAAFDEVWRSNMSKTPRPGGGKAIKGETYKPADMLPYVPKKERQ